MLDRPARRRELPHRLRDRRRNRVLVSGHQLGGRAADPDRPDLAVRRLARCGRRRDRGSARSSASGQRKTRCAPACSYASSFAAHFSADPMGTRARADVCVAEIVRSPRDREQIIERAPLARERDQGKVDTEFHVSHVSREGIWSPKPAPRPSAGGSARPPSPAAPARAGAATTQRRARPRRGRSGRSPWPG